jgi:septal ring factor EnvC (AmiA/AmiB activator)
MANIFDNIEFSQKVFLKVQYTTILEELELRKTHGQIVRRLVSEGAELQKAESLYQSIVENRQQTKSLADTLTKEIEQQIERQENEEKKRQEAYEKYEREQARQRSQEAEKLPAKYMQERQQKNSENEQKIKLGFQFASDILQKFLGI